VTPTELVLSKLPGAKRNGRGWKARCPAHDDQHPSLTVDEGDDGRALLCCHAGCSAESVVAAIGLKMTDLMPASNRSIKRPKQPPPTFVTAEAAIAELDQRHGRHAASWPYRGANGEVVGYVLRWNTSGGKDIRPVARVGNRWMLVGMPAPRPLYRLPELLEDQSSRVFVLEGEKAADAATSIGLLATTSPHGAKAARTADWAPLAGRHVVIFPDNDDAGKKYAKDVAGILSELNPPATVRVVDLPGLPEGGDFVEFLEVRDSQTEDEIQGEVEALVARTAPVVAAFPLSSPNGPNDRADSTPVLIRMSEVEPKALRWLWPGRVPSGKVTMIAGDPSLGKSLITIDMAARVSSGRDWPDSPAQPGQAGSVILLSAEDDPDDTIAPRLIAAGADCNRVHVLTTVRRSDGKLSTFRLEDIAVLEKAIETVGGVKLIVIDPISAYLGRADSHKNAEIRGLLAPLAELAQRNGVAIVVVSHLTKSSGGKAMYRTSGSLAFVAAARASHLVIGDPEAEDRRMMLPVKSNLGKKAWGLAYSVQAVPVSGIGDQPCVAWEPEPVELTADEVLAAEAARLQQGDGDENATEWLREFLAEGPQPSKAVHKAARECGYSAAAIRKAKKALKVRPRKNGFGAKAPWYWPLPGQQLPVPEPIDAQDSGAEIYGAYDENGHLCTDTQQDEGKNEPDPLFDSGDDPNRWRN